MVEQYHASAPFLSGADDDEDDDDGKDAPTVGQKQGLVTAQHGVYVAAQRTGNRLPGK